MFTTIILGCLLLLGPFVLLWCYLWSQSYYEKLYRPTLHKSTDDEAATSIPYYNRSYITWTDLLDKNIRADPHQLNSHLHKLAKNYPNGIIPVKNEHRTYLIVKYNDVKAILSKQNEFLLSSNPFPDNRLIAPNTMDAAKHAIIMKYIKSFYSPTTVLKQINIIEKIIQNIINNFINTNKQLNSLLKTQNITPQLNPTTPKRIFAQSDFMSYGARQIVMQTALFMIGLKPPALISTDNNNNNVDDNDNINITNDNGTNDNDNQSNDSNSYQNFPEISVETVNELIYLNDAMIALVAPLGGIGLHFDYSLFRVIKLLFGLIRSFIPTIQLIYTIGIKNAWSILRPDLSIFKIPNNLHPRLQIWFKPELLYTVPRYFLLLNKLYIDTNNKIKMDNINGINENINGNNTLETALTALKKGEDVGNISRDEILVTLVQLMVNMTTSNAIGNMMSRLANNTSFTVALNDLIDDGKCDENGKILNYVFNEKRANALIEEVLRFDAPLQRLPRRCRINMKQSKNLKYKIDGMSNKVRFYQNTNIICMIGAANCDPDIYERDYKGNSYMFDPWRFYQREIKNEDKDKDKDKENGNNNNNNIGVGIKTKPLTFGFGMHFCLGYWLVKREMLLTLKCLFKANIKNIEVLYAQRMDDIDVGNYGFYRLHVKLT